MLCDAAVESKYIKKNSFVLVVVVKKKLCRPTVEGTLFPFQMDDVLLCKNNRLNVKALDRSQSSSVSDRTMHLNFFFLNKFHTLNKPTLIFPIYTQIPLVCVIHLLYKLSFSLIILFIYYKLHTCTNRYIDSFVHNTYIACG